jgi:uncharacterized protein (TIGR03067 family)
MARYLLGVSLVITLAAAAASADGAPQAAAAGKLDGDWVATSWKRGEGEVGKNQVATELKITKDAYEFPTGINRISAKGAIKVDAAKGTIDFTPADGASAGRTLQGIYKVDGDTLTLCFTTAGRDRPKEFKSDDRMTVLAKYERKKK